jgi:SAM-dependent methyltransferase
MAEYVFQGGSEGADRLEILNQIFGPHSRRCLEQAGLCAGMNVIEAGCGTGAMTSWIAGVVGPSGSVTAIDADARQIALAERRAKDAGISNVRFVNCRIPNDDLPAAAFDLAYARLVLMHVREPETALRSLLRTLKAGGTIVCEEATSSTAFARPPHKVIAEINRLFEALGRLVGADFDVGDKLVDLVRGAGCRVKSAQFIQPMLALDAASRFLELGANEVRPLMLKTGLLTETVANELLGEILALSARGHGYYALGRVAQVTACA